MSEKECLSLDEVNIGIGEILNDNQELLFIIVDDSPIKTKTYQDFLEFQKSLPGMISYSYLNFTNGEDAVSFYEKLKTYDEGSSVRAIFLLDGNLAVSGTEYSQGLQVADKLYSLAEENSWNYPWFIGISNDPNLNEDLYKKYPDNPLKSIDALNTTVFVPEVSIIHRGNK